MIPALLTEIYLYNRRNFALSIAGQEVAMLPEGPVKTALLKKYGVSQEDISQAPWSNQIRQWITDCSIC
jgi:hypothetical protein